MLAVPNMDFNGFDFSDFNRQASGDRHRPPGRGAAASAICFPDFFRGGEKRAGRQSPKKGRTWNMRVTIDFWQAIRGTQAKIDVTRHEVCTTCHGSGQANTGTVTCPQCNGTGNVTQMAGAMKFNLTCPRCNGKGRLRNACPTCHGDGRITHTETVEVRIPAGAQDGSRLRVPGKGNAGTHGAPAGDLYITTRVEEHPFFKREGDQIKIQVPVTITEAGLGAKIEVPTIDGRALLKIPPGHAKRTEIPAARKGRVQCPEGPARRSDCRSLHPGAESAGRAYQRNFARTGPVAS